MSLREIIESTLTLHPSANAASNNHDGQSANMAVQNESIENPFIQNDIKDEIEGYGNELRDKIHDYSKEINQKYEYLLTAMAAMDDTGMSGSRNLFIYFSAIYKQLIGSSLPAQIIVAILDVLIGVVAIINQAKTNHDEKKREEIDYLRKQLIGLGKEAQTEPDAAEIVEKIRTNKKYLNQCNLIELMFAFNYVEEYTKDLEYYLYQLMLEKFNEYDFDKLDLVELLLVQEYAEKLPAFKKKRPEWFAGLENAIEKKIEVERKEAWELLKIEKKNKLTAEVLERRYNKPLEEKADQEKPFEDKVGVQIFDGVKTFGDNYSGGAFWTAWYMLWTFNYDPVDGPGAITLALSTLAFTLLMETNKHVMNLTAKKNNVEMVDLSHCLENRITDEGEESNLLQIISELMQSPKFDNNQTPLDCENIANVIYLKHYYKSVSGGYKQITKKEAKDLITFSDSDNETNNDAQVNQSAPTHQVIKRAELKKPSFIKRLEADLYPRHNRLAIGSAIMSGYISIFFVSWPTLYLIGALGAVAFATGPIGVGIAFVLSIAVAVASAYVASKKVESQTVQTINMINDRAVELHEIAELEENNAELRNNLEDAYNKICEEIDKKAISSEEKQELKAKHKPVIPDISPTANDRYLRLKQHAVSSFRKFVEAVPGLAYVFSARFWTGSLFNRSLNQAGSIFPVMAKTTGQAFLAIGAIPFVIFGGICGLAYASYKVFEKWKEDKHKSDKNLLVHSASVKYALQQEQTCLKKQLEEKRTELSVLKKDNASNSFGYVLTTPVGEKRSESQNEITPTIAKNQISSDETSFEEDFEKIMDFTSRSTVNHFESQKAANDNEDVSEISPLLVNAITREEKRHQFCNII